MALTVTFVSNYINHHQIPLSNLLYERYGEGYTFLQTDAMEEERRNMGWGTVSTDLPYVRNWDADEEEAKKLLLTSDVVIFGGTEKEERILPRLEKGLFTIRYSESIYKTGRYKFISPRGLKKKYRDHIRFRKAPVFMLCAGAYVAGDFSLIHAYPGKLLKWGYFPEFRVYEPEDLITAKTDSYEEDQRFQLLWVGRQIDWKHPEVAVMVADYLKKQGKSIHLTMIGEGPMRENLEQQVRNANLKQEVTFLPFMPPAKVREYMERTHLYLFTSDRQEGWGVVCQEAMNSGCCVVASQDAGCSRYLIHHGRNGMLYPGRRPEKACILSEQILTYHSLRKKLGGNAYQTVRDEWSPQVAADHLIRFMEEKAVADSGPVSYVDQNG